MNDPVVAIRTRNVHGIGVVVEPNPAAVDLDELSCDECNRPVGMTSVGVNADDTPITCFYSYHITTPVAVAHPVILCFDCMS